MAKAQPKRISEKLGDFTGLRDIHKPAEFEGIELVLTAVEEASGDLGDYLILSCEADGIDEPFFISTGAKPVMAQLEKLGFEDFPVYIRFRRQGRTWYLTD